MIGQDYKIKKYRFTLFKFINKIKKSDSKIRLLLFFIFTKAEIAMKYHLKFLRKHFS